jgi:hypothetical protein
MFSFAVGFAINLGLIFATRLLSIKEIVSLIIPAEKK